MGLVGAQADGGLIAPASLRSRQGPGTSWASRNFVSRAGWETEALVSVTFPSGRRGFSAGAPAGGLGPLGWLGGGREAESAAGVLQPPRGQLQREDCAAKGTNVLTSDVSPDVSGPVWF